MRRGRMVRMSGSRTGKGKKEAEEKMVKKSFSWTAKREEGWELGIIKNRTKSLISEQRRVKNVENVWFVNREEWRMENNVWFFTSKEWRMVWKMSLCEQKEWRMVKNVWKWWRVKNGEKCLTYDQGRVTNGEKCLIRDQRRVTNGEKWLIHDQRRGQQKDLLINNVKEDKIMNDSRSRLNNDAR